MRFEELDQIVSAALSKSRYQHTLAVTDFAVSLARDNGVLEEKAQTAAMLHDIAKQLPVARQLQILQESGILLGIIFSNRVGCGRRFGVLQKRRSGLPNGSARNRFRRGWLFRNEKLLHSLTGFALAKDHFEIEDPDILNAIRYHTTGRQGMSLLEKIVFTADAVSYDRDYPEAEALRELAFVDLDRCMLEICKFLLSDLMDRETIIAENTLSCYNSLCKKEQIKKKCDGFGAMF